MPTCENLPVVCQSRNPPPFPAYCAATVFISSEPAECFPEVFAVVTAYNPVGAVVPKEENQTAAMRLKQRLANDGHPTFEVTGASPDLAHQEPGEGFATQDIGYVAQLAREFGQWGFFWVEQGKVYICTDESGAGWHVGSWTEKLHGKQTGGGLSSKRVTGHDTHPT